MDTIKKYEIAIIGGGVSGTSLLYTLCNYSNLKNIILIEKYNGFAEVNSHYNNNSQTLHFGDIETNYNLEKAAKVKIAAELVKNYVEKFAPNVFRKSHKIALAVGEKEVGELEKRCVEFKNLFPKLKRLEKAEIAKIEPKVVEGRNKDEKILALYSNDGYIINFKKLAESFISNLRKDGKNIEISLETKLKKIIKNEGFYKLITDKEEIHAKAVVVAGGAHSLIFAKSLGYGGNYTILPIAGSFYIANNVLSGKVYAMQIKNLPFAAVHGDPDVIDPRETRFGPTAKLLPLIERHKYKSFFDFAKTSAFTLNSLISFTKLVLLDKTILFYAIKNIIYDIPIIGKYFFLKDAKKITPTIKYKDLKLAKGLGGIRPIIINNQTRKMEFGAAKIIGENIIFNITPSPGATMCLENSLEDAETVVKFLGDDFKFQKDKFKQDLEN